MRRILTQCLLLCVLVVLTTMGAVVAQDGGRALQSGVAQTGTLDSSAIVQVYTLTASAGQTVDITASAEGTPLALTLTDASGALVGQSVSGDTTGQVQLTLSLLTSGTFYVTVLKADNAAFDAPVAFTITATLTAGVAPEATPTPTESAAGTVIVQPTPSGVAFESGQVLTQSGISVSLTWGTTDDLDLEVRDPVGGSLYWETPTVDSGGTISANANQQCAVTSTSPSETATWSPGGVPTGSYEMLVYYQKSCTNNQPVTFALNVAVNGTSLEPVQGMLGPGQVFVASFVINADGTSALTGLSGIVTDDLPDTKENILVAATPIQFGISIDGLITNESPYQAYSFEGRTNDSVTVSMEATGGGSLDTFLFLLDPAGNIVQTNDDRDIGATNSLISNALLPVDGTYTIVATRYAKRIGGTEGTYTLNVTSEAVNLPQAFLDLPRGSLEVRLLWNTAADLQLQVRDASGNTVFDDVPEVRSGGRLAAQGNVNCRVSEGTPFSYIYWPTDIPPRPGTYEVEVWYQNECSDTSPVTASLFVNYNGQQVFNDTIRPVLNEHYLFSFTVTASNTFVPSEAGIIRGISDLDYTSRLNSAITLLPGEARSGIITQDNKFDVYLFTGSAGDVVNIAMNNTSGTLDPLLYVLNAAGNLVAQNDDAVVGENTNALVANLALPADGQYIIIATHYGGRYGGTTGTYSLTLTQLN